MKNDDMPELPEHGTASERTIDRRLEQTERDLEQTRDEIAKLRKSIRASLDGDHERAAALLDALDEPLDWDA
jgi:septal ring factor EnvC (AmiA/AmiB activator)